VAGESQASLIASERPDLHVWLIERRGARADFLRRVIQRLEIDERVTVHEADAQQIVKTHAREFIDGVTARGFGPPEVTLTDSARTDSRETGQNCDQ
jgi:16S rRNA G527 N7-methylase RsmG